MKKNSWMSSGKLMRSNKSREMQEQVKHPKFIQNHQLDLLVNSYPLIQRRRKVKKKLNTKVRKRIKKRRKKRKKTRRVRDQRWKTLLKSFHLQCQLRNWNNFNLRLFAALLKVNVKLITMTTTVTRFQHIIIRFLNQSFSKSLLLDLQIKDLFHKS